MEACIKTQKTQQPSEFYLLNFASMWECFSYYGMRALLVLFMVKELKLSDSQAYASYALYITLIELGGIIGGVLADRFLSLKGAIVIGGWSIFFGHLLLGLSDTFPFLFFLSLGLIASGTNLFRVNIPAAIGALSEKEENQRERRFTIFYATMNVGGLLASFICSVLGETAGWHAAFGAAAFGMLLGNIALAFKWNLKAIFSWKKSLLGIGYIVLAAPVIALCLMHAKHMTAWTGFILAATFLFIFRNIFYDDRQKKRFQLILFLILFYACEELLGSSVVLYAERYVNRSLFGFEIPSSMVTMINPLVILLAGAFVANSTLNPSKKINLSLLLLGGAFSVFYITSTSVGIPILYPLAAIAMISVGELFIGPTLFAKSAELSHENERGTSMGIVTLGFSCANLLSGFLSSKMALEEGHSLTAFQEGFGMIALAVFAVFLFTLANKRRYDDQAVEV